MGGVESVRVDTWLWAVRIFPTRTAATEACRGGHVRIGGVRAKPASPVGVGDRVEAYAGRSRVLEVTTLLEKRVGAPVAATCFVDHSPPPPQRRRQPRVAVRERGAGRPTKRERREIDRLRGA